MVKKKGESDFASEKENAQESEKEVIESDIVSEKAREKEEVKSRV
jgi:hypothetical protein